MKHASEIAERNKIQNLFLEEENVIKLLQVLFKKTSKNDFINPGETTFEGMFDWDLVVEDSTWHSCNCDEYSQECNCELFKQYVADNNIPTDCDRFLKLNNLYCKIKPSLGDDYPSVLRKMKTQIEQTNKYATKHNQEKQKLYKKEYDEDREMRKYYVDNTGSYNFHLKQESIFPEYVLIIKDFNSTATTKEQLIQIFNQSKIKIVFINELYNTLQTEENTTVTDNLCETQQKLLQAEERIKQLEEEIQLLKTKPKSKSK
jgi:hypothetical protein